MSEQEVSARDDVEALAACDCGHPIIDHFGGCEFCSCRRTHEMALATYVERVRAAERERLAAEERT